MDALTQGEDMDGPALMAMRKRAKVSQSDIGSVMGVSRQRVSQFEQRPKPSPDLVERYRSALLVALERGSRS
jgi:DNA-binding transcriptional regulator YiaG